MKIPLLTAYLGLACTAPLLAQANPPEEAPPEKALKYYEALTKRPAAGYLFDRFYNSWIDAQTIEALEKFLAEKAAGADATTNQRLVLAFFYAKQNESSRALEQFRKALEKDPGNPDAWFQKAQAEVRTLDFESALADLTKSLESKPAEDLARQIRQLQGRLLARLGKNEEALKAWQELLAAQPGDETLQEDLIELQLNEGLNDAALATAETLLAKTKDPYQKIQRRLRIGDIHSRMGNREQAVAAYVQCLDEVGGDSWLEKEILEQISLTFRRDDALEGLKNQYAELVAKYPQRLILRRTQARLLSEMGEVEAARKTFLEILALTPGDREVRQAYVALLADSKLFPEAVEQMNQLISQHPEAGELLIQLAELHDGAQQHAEAQKTLEEFLAKSNQSEETHLRVAALLERFKLPEASLALSAATVEKFPQSEAARENHAVALHKSGQKDAALAAWRKMATGGDLTRVTNVARQASAREEHALAYELLSARAAEFSSNSLFLTQLCDLAQRVDKTAEAVVHVRKLVTLAQDAIDLDSALTLAAKMIERAEQTDATIRSLQANAPTAQDKCLLAELLDRTGQMKEADALLLEVRTSQPEMATLLLVRLQSARSDYANAAETLRQLVATPQGHKPVHLQKLTELYERAGLLDKALEWLPEWKKLTPGSTQAWLKEAELKATLGKGKEALITLRQAVQQFEGNQDLRAQLGAAYRNEGKLADAERVFTQLYEEAQESAAKVRWAGELAQIAQQSGKTAELIEAFEERKRNNRTAVLPLLALAEIHRVLDNYEGRRQALLEAARIKRDDLDLQLEIARIAESQNQYDQALQVLREALPLDKSDKVKRNLVRVLFAAGREAEGKQLLIEIAGGANMDARAVEGIAETFIAQDAWKEAADFLAPFITQFPKDYRLAYQYAVSLKESSQLPAALTAFRRLLTLTEELPPAPSAALRNANTNVLYRNNQKEWLDSLRKNFPAGAVEYLRVAQSSYLVLGYLQNRNNGGARLTLPSEVGDVPAYAILHLTKMQDELAEAPRRELLQEMQAHSGIPQVLLMSLDSNLLNNGQMNFTDLLSERPDDENVAALAVLYGGSNRSLDEAERLTLYRNLKDKWPVLATYLGLAEARSENPEALQNFAQSVSYFEHLETCNDLLMQPLYQLFGNNQEEDTAEVTPVLRQQLDRLQAKLLVWYRTADRTNPSKAYLYQQLFQMVLGSLMRQDDPTELIAMFDAEILSFASESGKGRAGRSLANPFTYSSSSRNNRGQLLANIPFPPPDLADFPPLILSLFGDINQSYARNWQPDPDKLKAVISKAQDPVLKVLLAHKAGDEEAVTAAVKTLTEAPTPSFSHLLLAASWAARQEQPSAAIALLHRAEYLPLTKEQRRALDSSILFWASEMQGRLPNVPAADSSWQAIAQASALRIQRGTLTPNQKQELADLMEQLGMQAEAKRLSAALDAANQHSGPAASVSGSFRSRNFNANTTPVDRIDAMIQKGETSAVIKLWQKELRDLARRATTSVDQNLSSNGRSWLQTMRQKMASAEKVIYESMMPPADSQDGALYGQAAAVADLFGKKGAAKDFYLKALQLKPKDQMLRLVAMLFLMKDSPDEAAEIMKSLDPRTVSQAGQSLSNIVDNLETNQQRLQLARLVDSYLQGLKPEVAEKTDFTWVLYFIEQFARSGYDRRDGNSLPSLYSRQKPRENPEKLSATEREKWNDRQKLQAERRQIHDTLCQHLATHPQSACFAFSKLAAISFNEGRPATEFLDSARAALQKQASSTAGLSSRRNYSYYRSSEDIPFPTPESVVLESALLLDKPELITGEIVPMLTALHDTQTATALSRDAKLYFATPEEFPAASASFVKASSQRSSSASESESLVPIIKVLRLRKLDLELEPLLLATLKKSALNYNGGQEMQPVTDFAQWLLDLRHPERAAAFLDAVATLHLGPFEKRAAFFQKNFTNSWGGNSPGSGIHKWLNLFQEFRGSPEMLFLMADCYERNISRVAGLDLKGNFNPNLRVEEILKIAPGTTPVEQALNLLRASTWLAPVTEFRPRQIKNFCVNTLNQVSEHVGSDQRGELRSLLEKEPPTFGRELLLIFFPAKGSFNISDFYEVLGKSREALQKMPEPDQQAWAEFLGDSDRSSEKLSETAQAGKSWLDSLKNSASATALETFLQAKPVRDSNDNTASYVESSLRALLPIAWKEGLPQAETILTKARELLDFWQRTSNNSSSRDASVRRVISQGFVNALNVVSDEPLSDSLPTALRHLAQTLTTSGKWEMVYDSSLRSAVGNSLRKLYAQSDSKEAEVRSKAFVKLVTEKLPAEATALFLPEMISAITNSDNNPSILQSLLAWFKKEALAEPVQASLAELLYQGLELVRIRQEEQAAYQKTAAAEARLAKEEQRAVKTPERHSHHGIVAEAELPPSQKALLAAANQPNWPASARFALLSAGVNLAGETAEPALLVAAIRSLSSFGNKSQSGDSDSRNVIDRFVKWVIDPATQPSEAIKSLSAELLASWRRAYLQRNSSLGAEGFGFVDLALTLHDTNALQQLLSAIGNQASRMLLCRMVSAREFELAKRVLAKGREQFYSANNLSSTVINPEAWLYSPTLAAALPDFLATLATDAERFTAEVILGSLPSPQELTLGDKAPERMERMKKTAARITPELIPSPEQMERLMGLILGCGVEASEFNSATLEKVSQTISMGSLPDLNNSDMERRKRSIRVAYLRQRLASNDLEPMRQTILELVHSEAQDRSDLGRLAKEVTMELLNASNGTWKNLDAPARKANRDFWTALLFDKPASATLSASDSIPGITDYARLVHVLMLHAWEDVMPEFNIAYAGLDQAWKDRLADCATNTQIDKDFNQMNGFPWPEDKEQRLKKRSEIFLKMLQTDLPQLGQANPNFRYFHFLQLSELMSSEGFLAHAEEFAKSFPNGGATLIEQAERLVDTNQREAALPVLRRSRQIPLSEKPDHAAWTTIMRAENFHRLDRLEEAINVLETMPEKVLAAKQKENHETFTKRQTYLRDWRQALALQQGKFEQVMQPLLDGLTQAPGDDASLIPLGDLFKTVSEGALKQKDFAAAAAYAAAALLTHKAANATTGDFMDQANAIYLTAQRDLGNPSVPATLLERRQAHWSYVEPRTPAPAAWNDPATDASQWLQGDSPIGYGENDLGTTIIPKDDPSPHPQVGYFRTILTVPEQSERRSLEIRLRRDDGAVVYLNGHELFRDNLPEGPLEAATRAKEKVTEQNETHYFIHACNAEHLQAGKNVLAVEVHQSDLESSDLTLDAEIILNPQSPALTIQSLDPTAMIKALGPVWEKLPKEIQARLLGAQK